MVDFFCADSLGVLFADNIYLYYGVDTPIKVNHSPIVPPIGEPTRGSEVIPLDPPIVHRHPMGVWTDSDSLRGFDTLKSYGEWIPIGSPMVHIVEPRGIPPMNDSPIPQTIPLGEIPLGEPIHWDSLSQWIEWARLTQWIDLSSNDSLLGNPIVRWLLKKMAFIRDGRGNSKPRNRGKKEEFHSFDITIDRVSKGINYGRKCVTEKFNSPSSQSEKSFKGKSQTHFKSSINDDLDTIRESIQDSLCRVLRRQKKDPSKVLTMWTLLSSLRNILARNARYTKGLKGIFNQSTRLKSITPIDSPRDMINTILYDFIPTTKRDILWVKIFTLAQTRTRDEIGVQMDYTPNRIGKILNNPSSIIRNLVGR